MTIGKYLRWKDENGNEFRPVSLTGTELLNDRTLNKSTAFTYEERDAFQLDGLLPPRVQTFEDQLNRVYDGFKNASTDIEKYLFLRALQDRNETLFYALLSRHVEEMTPIIYTPTVGKACQEFSHRYQKARGLYITEDNVENMDELARHFTGKDIKIIVVTDSQGILGLGDQGVGGMGIPIGKLSLYTLGAGIHPAHCLPIALDVGTDNQDLLDDPMYLGVPRRRMRGEEYKRFIHQFVVQVKRNFPKAVLQWEDFSKSNAFDNLSDYEEYLPSFNDDIQGTGSVVLAGILGAVKIKGESLVDQHYVVYGAGAGGVGVADQIFAGLLKEGCSHATARGKIFILDSQGLVFDDRDGLDEYKKRYAKPRALAQGWEVSEHGKVSLTELIDNYPVTVLLGTSGIGGAFKEGHIQKMMEYTRRPMIFPLSNPTANCEALPEDIYRWSDGQAIVATGSPFADVNYSGQDFRIGQGNNVFIFPGVGLAAIVSKTQKVTLDMFTTASYALAEMVADDDLAAGCVYPRISSLKQVSLHVATRILTDMQAKDPKCDLANKDIVHELAEHTWEPIYLPYRRV
ncbi:NAD-dependent malic enzyme [Photobacterium lutimaris]|uniref:NAD-dependent malic enzyme n=1 Tax=Photobacterium lutimaris TaxID=388278 RepID=A0A2T3J393_9GAMM|nr:NAD-dependent malic enzyme [Photobacterium lutimaris]PSU35723.1 NAD-dependent malic enzyme [Photobacterium lutimaris]TDR78787.1 malate dehydrogenase (oxaloacetate-decarboxylating)/malate dehydrogenase (oxaloacetate-decarboxylating)(NADP+) [Photobacterium lutimaris]